MFVTPQVLQIVHQPGWASWTAETCLAFLSIWLAGQIALLVLSECIEADWPTEGAVILAKGHTSTTARV